MDIFEASRSNQIGALDLTYINDHLEASDPRGSTPLIIATYYNHVDAAAILINLGANPDRQDAMGNTPLMGACFKGHTEVARLLLDGGANVDAVNGNLATALTFAATFGRVEIIEMLLTAGANPMARDSTGKTPVDHASIQENEACYELLAAAANEQIRQAVKH